MFCLQKDYLFDSLRRHLSHQNNLFCYRKEQGLPRKEQQKALSRQRLKAFCIIWNGLFVKNSLIFWEQPFTLQYI